MKRTIYNTLVAKQTIAPAAARTLSTTGQSVDLLVDGDAARSTMVVVHTGVVTDGTHTVELQDSPDNSTWTAVADEFLQGTEPAITSSNDERVHEIGYTGHKRYLRVVVTVSGSPVAGGFYGATVLMGWPRTMPPARS